MLLFEMVAGAPSTLVSQWMKNPNKIPDKLLQLQVKTVSVFENKHSCGMLLVCPCPAVYSK